MTVVYQWSSTVDVDSLYHVALTFDQGFFKGYVDGRLEFTVAGPALAPGGFHPAILGAHMLGNRHFQGLIDEFRIESKGRGPGWIRMSFENQKPASASVLVE